MTITENLSEVRTMLQKFQDGYTARDVGRLDDFMQLFIPNDEIEMIGIGAAKRSATEWFEGRSRIREIIESDWLYWGNVRLDIDGAKITIHGETAWLSTTGTVTQTQAFDTAIEFHLNDMKAIFDQEDLSTDEKLMEATHYGMRRLRERSKGIGHSWPFTFTAILIKVETSWRFHTLHWAMPVD
jgi:hypothetical protein